MKHGECVLHKVFISYFFLGSQRMPNFALFRGLEDAEISPKHDYSQVISNILSRAKFHILSHPFPSSQFFSKFSCPTLFIPRIFLFLSHYFRAWAAHSGLVRITKVLARSSSNFFSSSSYFSA